MTVTGPATDSDRQAVAPADERSAVAEDQDEGDDHVAEGEWLDTRAAMLHLGISERTLHRRINRGELQKRHRPGGRVEVWVATARRRSATDAEADSEHQARQIERTLALVERFGVAVNQQVAPLLDLVREQERTIRVQASELGQLRERVVQFELQQELALTQAAELGRLRQKLVELERLRSASDTASVVDGQRESAAGRGVSWWRRILG